MTESVGFPGDPEAVLTAILAELYPECGVVHSEAALKIATFLGLAHWHPEKLTAEQARDMLRQTQQRLDEVLRGFESRPPACPACGGTGHAPWPSP